MTSTGMESHGNLFYAGIPVHTQVTLQLAAGAHCSVTKTLASSQSTTPSLPIMASQLLLHGKYSFQALYKVSSGRDWFVSQREFHDSDKISKSHCT
jgi:hypothetical protein